MKLLSLIALLCLINIHTTAQNQKLLAAFPKPSDHNISGKTSGLDCDPITLDKCNYITNCSFEPVSGYSPCYNQNQHPCYEHFTIPFELDLVLPWLPSHGTPQLDDYHGGTPPFAGIHYAFMGAAESFGEGIFQKIPPLEDGKQYALSFFKKYVQLSYSEATHLDKFYIVLMNCDDAGDFGPSYSGYPEIPAHSQIIYCGENITNTSWNQVFTCFTAGGNYDVIWIFPKQESNPNISFNYGGIDFAYPEIIDVSNFDAGISPSPSYPNNCSVKIGPDQPNCGVKNAVFTWNGPNGEVVTAGADQTTTVNASSQYGNWQLSMTVPGASTANNCGSTCSIKDRVNVPYCCNGITPPTVSPSGPITYYNQYETNNQLVLTSSSATGNQWYKNGVAISGATGQTYTIQFILGSDYTDTYRVSVGGCLSNIVSFHYISCEDDSEYPVQINRIVSSCTSYSSTTNQVNLGTGATYTWTAYNDSYTPCTKFPSANPVTSTSTSIQMNMSSCSDYRVDKIITKAENNGVQVYMCFWSFRNGSCRTMGSQNIITETTGIKLIPNPANSFVTIISENIFDQIEIYDLYNRFPAMIIKSPNSKTKTININSLKPGHYYCKIITIKGVIYQRLLIER